jgi:cystathionine beta-lyase/cystathionine gamma-synthase
VRSRSAGHKVVRVDTSDTAAVAAALAAHAPVGLLWVETPTNPTLKVADIEALVTAAAGTGALVVVDNTVRVGVFFRFFVVSVCLSALPHSLLQ